jgi:prolycopene isomerase
VGVIAEKLVAGLESRGGAIRYGARVTQVLIEGEGASGQAVGVKLANGEELHARRVVSNATRWDTFAGEAGSEGAVARPLVDAAHTPAAEHTWRRRYRPSPSFLSLHLGVAAEAIPPGTHVHHLLLERWQDMEAEQGVVFVSMPSLLDSSVAPAGHHIVHTFTPSSMEAWQGLTPAAYRAKKQADAERLVARLEAILPGLKGAIRHKEIGTPRSHRRFLGRMGGSYGPIPAMRLPGLLPMPFNRTGVRNLYCVGDSCFPGQGLNAVAFSGFACAHRIGADLGLNPWRLPD